MKLKSIISILTIIALSAIGAQAQNYWGYANEATVSHSTGLRFSSGTKQGFAIKIPKEKAALLKGSKVTGLRACFATGSNISNCKAFISSSLGENKDFEESVTPKLRIRDYDFTGSYTISGETDLYVGFELDYNSTNLAIFSVDNTAELPEGFVWAYTGQAWENVACNGAPAIYLSLDKAPEFKDVLVKPVSFDAFYTAGKKYDFTGQVFNSGSEAITSLDMGVTIGNGSKQTMQLTGLNIAPLTTYDYMIEKCAIDVNGNLPITVSISNVNGSADADITDNTSTCSKYIYPANVVRRTLLETFTGLGCYNCPAGTTNIKHAIAGNEDNFSLIAHHTYGPDVFCMTEDYEMTWFFAGQTYAPGIMANRRPYNSGLTTPIVQATTLSYVTAIIEAAKMYAPYVDISVNSAYNSSTREVSVTVNVTTHEATPYEVNRLNIWLTQDNFSGQEFPQQGASSDYSHNNVFRASLTGVWGEDITLVPGETVSKTYTYTLPTESVSTYSPAQYAIKWIAEDMKVIAFVCGASNSQIDCPIYNVAETALADSSGVDDMIVECEYTSQEVYTLQGVRVADTTLSPGIYIIRRIATDGHIFAEKVVVK